MDKKPGGRPPNVMAIEQFKELRKKKRSFRQIAKIMNRDLKTLWRWSKLA